MSLLGAGLPGRLLSRRGCRFRATLLERFCWKVPWVLCLVRKGLTNHDAQTRWARKDMWGTALSQGQERPGGRAEAGGCHPRGHLHALGPPGALSCSGTSTQWTSGHSTSDAVHV